MTIRNRNSRHASARFFRMVGILILTGLAFGCSDWHEFGHGPTNPHNTFAPGPTGGVASVTPLVHPTTGSVHGAEVGVLTDSSGDYYVTSYDSEIHVYDPTGTHQVTYTLPVGGSRAVPYIVNFFLDRKSFIFTGAEGGGFYVIEIDKSGATYTATLVASDTTVGSSESSPKRAQDGNFYLAEMYGDIIVFSYDFATTTLTRVNTYSVGEVVTGAIALFDCEPAAGEEVLVATKEGGFYVLDHTLSGEIWSETTGLVNADEYYAGVTVAERGSADPVALLPMAGRIESPPSSNSGRLRAINLATRSIEWELTPSATTPGVHEIPGSVSLLHPFTSTGTGITSTTTTPTDGTTVTTTTTVDVTPGGDIGGVGSVTINGHIGTDVTASTGDNQDNTNTQPVPNTFLATFASTDEYLYGVDIVTGLEVWSYWMRAPGFDAPVTDRSSVVFVGDGTSTLHAVFGPIGAPVWVNPVISVGGVEDIVKLGLSYYKELIVASGNSAYSLLP